MTTYKPFFSIIIPTYERHQQLIKCLESVSNLDYPRDKYEVIVVDDGSSDPPLNLVSSFSARLDIKIHTQVNGGPASARNTGAGVAGGEYLAFTDDDCEPGPNWLNAFAEAFKAVPQNFLGGHTINSLVYNPYSQASQDLIDYLYSYYNPEPDKATFFASNNIAVPASMFRDLGGFDVTTLRATAEDREICDRWLKSGFQMTYVKDAVVHHSHNLNFRTYCRQHFNYGRGAYYFRKLRAARGQERIKIEPLSFYYNLSTFPLRSETVKNPVYVCMLMLLSQITHTGGYFWEYFIRSFLGKA